MQPKTAATPPLNSLDDMALVERAQHRDPAALRHIMEQNNRRLYRVARSVLGDDTEAEDVVQETYLRAFTHLDGFRGEARLGTWLTRIALNEALGRLRTRRTSVDLKQLDTISEQGASRVIYLPSTRQEGDPEAAAARAEVRRFIERAVDQLPDPFRIVFVLRDIEEMSTEATASQLGLRLETVKTRLHRARRLLRQNLDKTLSTALADTFPFAGMRCARITQAVLARLGTPVTE
ncbi:RNA polymerase sigma-70 factor (ECF subfamily) [Microvirga lupini]|uniref:RNA polymerase sigma factor n=1 Tax=Microvirga lupini TaxID=420324 RepID=A0A7W4YVN9_9HYPH|nr:RNA polymerase sigma factor [Microvirga lupini]MBB3018652.1 RNA polymerase sigma-70 factor (ECF subfamily) [Microvirga lupini]